MVTPTSGQLIGGRYRLRDRVGKGGFGAVYVADQVGMDRPVALKVLTPEGIKVMKQVPCGKDFGY